VHPRTLASRRRLYLLSRVVVSRHYRRRLTLAQVAAAVSSSPRQVQRAFAQCGDTSFQEELLARRLSVAAQLLAEQPGLTVRDVARLAGYRQAPAFARAFRRRYGRAPAAFRAAARAHRARAELGRDGSHDRALGGDRLRRDGLGARKLQPHERAASLGTLGRDAAAVLSGNLAHDREAEA
jgi:AraC family transcriptional regulator, regulatory protein of adaptative response / methylphosphotriester-DNA alkyltransferase methyltransferase